jgi:long-chain fatty acid transport protein
MKKRSLAATILLTCASSAFAGGFELQKLDTSMMYGDGNQASISQANINYSVEGLNPGVAGTNKKVVPNISVTNFSAKFDYGESLSFGLGTYRSGAIQLIGGNTFGANLTPTADVDLNTTALLARYNLNENVSFLGGVTQNTVTDGNVATLAGTYKVSGTSEMGYVTGVAYSIPEIALRAELIYQPKTKFTTTTAYTRSPLAIAALGITADGPNSATTLALPDTMAINFQTGIAADTLLTASYRKTSWGKAQVKISAPAAVETKFKDTSAYSLGIGRKFTDSLSGSITYAKEPGTGATSTSLFSVSNGSDAISIGLQYKRDNMTLSGGISQRKVGDMHVTDANAGQMKYSGNTVTAMGLKISFAF